ncbi:MAG: hypothetical protein NW203_14430 [Hyphomonadaceae bacterium]|nr:hypothetical protein [Hyphomonadaceae bacterium]
MPTPSRARALAAASLAAAVAACSSFTLRAPTDNQTFSAATTSVPVRFDWTPTNQSLQNFRATLTNPAVTTPQTDVTSRFTLGAGSGAGSVPVTLGPGQTLRLQAELYDPLYRRTIARDQSVTFNIGAAPSFSLRPIGDILVERGASAAAPVTITPTGGFADAVTLSVQAAGGVTATSSGVPAGSTTGAIAVTAAPTATFGAQTLTVNATSGALSDSERFDVVVGRAAGPFSAAGFAVTTPPQSGLSADGAVRVRAVLGSSLPGPSAFGAIFETAATGAPLGPSVPYNHGRLPPNVSHGGAGFCAGSSAAFVLSGSGPGVTTGVDIEYQATFRNLAAPNAGDVSVDVNQLRTGPGIPSYSFTPLVMFSPDCTLALAVGAHPIGPVNNLAIIVDVARARVLGSVEFNPPSFTATVETSGTAQRVVLTWVDQGQTISQATPIP